MSKAPLRLGLAGGGTDVSPYCDDMVGSCKINLYAYCTIEPTNDGQVVFYASDRNERLESTSEAVLPRMEFFLT